MSISHRYFQNAQKIIPGGVNSPVRAFRAVGGEPFFVQKGKGAKLWDVDGKSYIDYVMSWGALILGHAHPEVVRAIQQTAKLGTTFGAATYPEVELAELIQEAFPSIEKVRLVSSGTEAVMSAIRVARGATKRKIIVKFDGCYHGHSDGLLVQAGSGALTFGVPNSAGVPQEYAALTQSLPYNNTALFKGFMKEKGREVACVIVEPVAANMGLILPESGFLETLREETKKYGAVLIFDEVITGFRLSWGGAQELFKIQADLTCLGKILGGGMPLAAFGGKKELMDKLAPLGPVYQAGTLSGNPVAVAAGLAALKILKKTKPYKALSERTHLLVKELKKISPTELQWNTLGSLFTPFFNHSKVVDFQSAMRSNQARFGQFFQDMLKEGVFLAPSQFEANFVSTAHTKLEFDKTVKAFQKAIQSL